VLVQEGRRPHHGEILREATRLAEAGMIKRCWTYAKSNWTRPTMPTR
jgi:hypothetical protein